MDTVLVTGGTGFVSGWCVVDLLRRGYRVRTTVRSLSKEPAGRAAIAAAVGMDADIDAVRDRLSFAAADLGADDGWDDAVAGCTHVLHIASPMGGGKAADRWSLVEPARDGAVRVLRAAAEAGVRRVVMTSAAATARPPLNSDRVSDETIWADPDDPQFDAYRVSKIVAERAAWDFMATTSGSLELTTVLPGAVFGPIMSADNQGSVTIIADLLRGRPPAMPRLGFWVVDVRDLADLHLRAMLSPDAAGERFLAAGDFLWLQDIAGALRTNLGSRADKVPTRRLPTPVVKLLLPALPNLRTLAPLIGRRFPLDSEKARRVLGFSPRPGTTTVIDCAESLLNAHGDRPKV